MRALLPLVTFLTASIAFATVGCVGSGDDSSCATSATGPVLSEAGVSDASPLDATVDARADAAPVPGPDAAVSVAPSAVASVRIANWSSDAPAIDFCLAVHGTTDFQGPELANLTARLEEAGVADAGAAALAFPGASAYFQGAPGQYDARVVAGGALDCSAKIIPDTTNLPLVAAGQALTIGLVGATHPAGTQSGLRTIGLRDDTAASNTVALRALNASPDLPLVALGTLSPDFQPLFPSIAFGFVASSPGGDASVDSNDYLTSPAFAGASFAVRPAGKSGYSAVSKPPLSIAAGAVVTMVIVGVGAPATTDGGLAEAQLVECVDNAGTLGNASSCSVVSSP